MNLKNLTTIFVLTSVLSSISIARSNQPQTCDGLLNDCVIVVESQEAELDLKEEVIQTQAELIRESEKEIKRVEAESGIFKGIATGEAAALLLLLLL